MVYEIVHLTHDNSIDLKLLADSVAVDLTNTTRMTLTFDTTIIDSDLHADVFDWSNGAGELYLTLGAQTIPAGTYYSELVVYDSANTNGIVWGSFTVLVV
jgi:hypothetical protein